MSGQRGAAIIGVGMTSALGLKAPTIAAAVRAGLSGFQETAIMDRRWNPLAMALVPEDDLPPLVPALEATPGLTTRQMRMLRLAGAALRESVEGEMRTERIPLLLAVPDAHPGRPAPVGLAFLEQLGIQAETPFHVQRSRLIPHGRAAGFMALREALDRLQSGADGYVLVGGVDSYLDLYLLGTLDLEERIRAQGIYDGFTPGEGAAFLLLTTAENARRMGREVIAQVDEAAFAEEPGHRYSEEVYRGDGLDLAFRGVFAGVPGSWGPAQTVYAGLNGESFNAKEWGVAYIRHRARFVEAFKMEHPADCLGDMGAALGPMLVGLAAMGMRKGYRRAPCAVWCSSDKAERGAALMSVG